MKLHKGKNLLGGDICKKIDVPEEGYVLGGENAGK